jgi:hypothetical protein
MHEGETLLQRLEFGPFHNTEFGILNIASIDDIKTMIQPTEIIDLCEI